MESDSDFFNTPAVLTLSDDDTSAKFPLRRNLLLTLKWDNGKCELKPPQVVLPENEPYYRLKFFVDPTRNPDPCSNKDRGSNYVIEIEQNGTIIQSFERCVRIPIPVIPFNESNYNSNNIFLNTRINAAASSTMYGPQELASWLNGLLNSDDASSHVIWIQGAYGSGKSSFVHRLQQYLKGGLLAPGNASGATCRWLIVDLARLAYQDIYFDRDTLDNHMLVELNKGSGYGKTMISGAEDEDRRELFQEHYARAYNKGFRGIIYLADEFDQFRPRENDQSITSAKWMEHLLKIMSVVPFKEGEANSRDLTTVLLIADYKCQKDRMEAAFEPLLDQITTLGGERFRRPQFHEYSLIPDYSLDDIERIFKEVIPPAPIKSSKQVTQIAKQIRAWTNGHRTCTNRLLFEYFDYCYSQPPTPSDWEWPKVDKILCEPEAMKRVQQTVDSLWESCEKISPSGGGKIEAKRTAESERDVLKRILKHELLSEEETNSCSECLDALVIKGLITKSKGSTGAYSYRIANPLLRFGMQLGELGK